MSRLFVAIQLSDEIKKAVTASLHEMKKQGIGGNYVPTGNLHLTLAFIGETKETDAVKDALKTLQYKPFKLTGAARGVRSALENAGISYEKDKFVPHITLIRKFTGNWKKAPIPKGEMMVKKISLMKSEQKNGKQVYTEIFSV